MSDMASSHIDRRETTDDTGTCFNCGSCGPIHNHHVVPRGKVTVPLCEVCHGLAHLCHRGSSTELTRAALRKRKGSGQVYSRTPFGYERKGAELVELRRELDAVARVQAWRAEGLSLRAIAARLTAAGVATKRGGRWQAQTVRYLLQNDLYTPAKTGWHHAEGCDCEFCAAPQ